MKMKMKTTRNIAFTLIFALLGTLFSARMEAKCVTKMALYRGETVTLTLKKNGKKIRTGKDYLYRISGKKVVSVTNTGKVKAKKAGIAKITIRHRKSGKKYIFKITVADYVKDIKLNSATSISMREGETRKLSLAICPKTAANKKISFRSSDKKVVLVNEDGEIAAQKKGVATISITSKGTTKEKKKITKKVYIYVEEKQAVTETTIPMPQLPGADGEVVEGSVIIGGGSEDQDEKNDIGDHTTPSPEATDHTTPSPEATDHATPSPEATDHTTPSPDVTDHATPNPDVTDGTGGEEGNTADSKEEEKKETLADVIAKIPVPDSSTIVAAKMAVKGTDGAISTLYFLNREYTGSMHVKVENFDLSAEGSVVSILQKLTDTITGNGVSVSINPGNKQENKYFDTTLGVWRDAIIVTRPTKEDAWLITNRKSGREYRLCAFLEDSVYGTPYGLIVAEGNTLSDIEIQG